MNESRILAGLPIFRAVATLGSFSTAAGQLGVTPSAVSQSIRALEDQLAVQLIARTSRSMRLTEAGAQLLADIDAPLAQLGEAMQGVRSQGAQIEGPLRISLSRLAAETCIRPHLPGFVEAYPAIRLELACDDRPTDIVKGGYDAAIRMRASLEGDMISLPIGPPLRRSVVASPAYLARHGSPNQPEDLMGHRLSRYRLLGSQRVQPLSFQRGETRLELDPPPAMVLDDLSMIGTVLRSGQVMAQIFHAVEAAAIRTGTLIEVLTEFEPPPMQFHIYYPSRVLQTGRLRAFLDWFARGKRDHTRSVDDAVLDQLGPLNGQEVVV